MDPDGQTAAAILSQNGIDFHCLQRLQRGLRNIVFQVDDQYVLRMNRQPASHACMLRECDLNKRLRAIAPVPQSLKFGIFSDNSAYQLWEFVPGEQLADVWPGLDPTTQVQLVDELCAILEQVHAVKFDGYGPICSRPHSYATWVDYARAELADSPFAEGDSSRWRQVVDRLRFQIWERINRCQWVEKPALVHNDLLMTNVIVRDGHIAALIDWELALRAPLDHETYKLESFCRFPGVVGVSGDFHRLWELIVRRYPAMFSHPDLKNRLDAQGLLALWRMFRYDVQHGHDPRALASDFIKRVGCILEGRVDRLAIRT